MLHNIDSQKVAQSDFLCEECVSGDRTLVSHDDQTKMVGEGSRAKVDRFFLVYVFAFWRWWLSSLPG